MSRGGRMDNGAMRKRRSERSRSSSPLKGDPKRIAGGRDGDRRSGAGSMGERMVFITNLAYEVRWVELKDILREHGGEVVFVELLEDRNGHPKGNAIAEFKTKEGAAKCIKNLDGFEIRKRKIITKPIRLYALKSQFPILALASSFFSMLKGKQRTSCHCCGGFSKGVVGKGLKE
ncbi:hypothetical protein OSTOST_05650 [Ostertagia ostertagi]